MTGATDAASTARGLRLALTVWAVLLVVVLGAELLAPHDPAAILDPVRLRSQGPSWAHPLGTDPSARDVLSRLLVGARTSLALALGAVAVGTSIGVLVGSAAALTGGVVDRALMRLSEVVLAVPRVLLLLTLVALWQVRSTAALVVVIGVTGWMATSRLVRDELRSALRDDRVLAARALGVPRRRLVQHHLLPAVLPLVAVTMTGAFAQVLLLEAGLSVVGLGVQPPEASWGSVLHDVSDVIGRARWLALGPGAVIMLTALATQRIGDVVQQRLLIPHRSVPPGR